MYLLRKDTHLKLPWSTGQESFNSSSYITYQWTPDPYIFMVVLVLMVIVTLMPALCSLCYHVFGRKEDSNSVGT